MTKKILIVDDEPAIGRLMLYQLQGCGYQVSYVSDGLLALQRLARERPDLVLLDVMMPTISGWEICRQIRECSSVPIIMVTGKNADLDVVTGLGAGADDYISKPFSMAQLQARIEAVLRRSASNNARRTEGAQDAAKLPPNAAASRSNMHPDQPATSNHALDPHAPEEEPLDLEEAPTPPTPSSALPQRLGPLLRETRLARGLTLNQVESDCKIRWEFLQAIEQENFAYVPRKQLRIAMHVYATYLGLDLQALAGQPVVKRRMHSTLHFAALGTLMVLLLVVGLFLLGAVM